MNVRMKHPSLHLALFAGLSLFCLVSPLHAGDPSLNTELVSPQDAAVFNNYPRALTLQWKPVLGASKYLVEIQCSVKDMDTGKINWIDWQKKEVTEAQFTIKMFAGAQPGRWRVTAFDSAGGAGDASDWRTFRFTK
jgi:hypothetical protein